MWKFWEGQKGKDDQGKTKPGVVVGETTESYKWEADNVRFLGER